MMNTRSYLAIGLIAFAVAGCSDDDFDVEADSGSTPPADTTFNYVEGTITQAHAAMRAGNLTCAGLVQGYIDRIRAYDAQGPQLRSVIRVNPLALDRARMLDAAFEDGDLTGPLHCVPMLLKDNFDTEDVTTTAGGLALQYNQPPDDAFSVAGLIDDGAIVLGKANLDEFAFGFQGISSVRGQVRNAYDPTKGPGGSSSGTGAAIAASFAMVGTGSDTGGSIRVPSSLGGLVGIRPSLRLVSQDGIVPLAASQDTGGPMCRTVEDCTLMLDAMVGFDDGPTANQRVNFAYDSPLITSSAQYRNVTNVPETYTRFLDANALDGARIAAIQPLFGNGEGDNAQVQAVMNQAIADMRAAGATVDVLTADDLAARNVDIIALTDFPSNSRFEFRADLTSYLMSWSSNLDGHLRSFDAVESSGGYLDSRAGLFDFYGRVGRAIANPDENNTADDQNYRALYQRNIEERPDIVRNGLMRVLDNRDGDNLNANALGAPYDILLYPSILGLAPSVGSSPNAGSNNRLSPYSGFPALSMPAGMVQPQDADNDDSTQPPMVPVGMELLAREFDEPTLIRLAYSYQATFSPRQAPTFTPELSTETE